MFFKTKNKKTTCNEKFVNKIKENEFNRLVDYLNYKDNGFADDDFQFELEDKIFILYSNDQQVLLKEKIENTEQLLEIDDTLEEYIILTIKKDGHLETVHMVLEEE